MEFIGEIIELQGWDKYQGGLDVNSSYFLSFFLFFIFLFFFFLFYWIFLLYISADKNGVHSLYTEYAGNEIMWHVPTLMPYFAADEQQVIYTLKF